MQGYNRVELRDIEVGDEVISYGDWVTVTEVFNTVVAVMDNGVETFIDRMNITNARRWEDESVDIEGDLQESLMESDTFDPYDAIPFGDAQAYEDNQVFNDHEGEY